MDASVVRKVNLIEVLGESNPQKLQLLPGHAAHTWTEKELMAYFEGSGTAVEATAKSDTIGRCGGLVVQSTDPDTHKFPPPEVRKNQLLATVEGYRDRVISDGIPFRECGLFPPEDSLLLGLAAQGNLHPFEKHLAGTRSPYQLLEKGSWERSGVQRYGTLVGAARLGDRASIGNGFWMSAHGGAVESILDEATAELSKMEFSPIVSTIELANFKIKKPVPLHTSLRVDCSIASTEGLRCWVHGMITLPETGAVLATADAQLVDLKQLWEAQGLF